MNSGTQEPKPFFPTVTWALRCIGCPMAAWSTLFGMQTIREAQTFPKVRRACDLACGTGTTAIELGRRGIKVFAVDLSPTMCRLARSKARSAGAHMVVIRGDMRTLSLPERVDLVTCEYDAVNHLPRKSDLARTAKAVARALRPGGYFYFDVNNRRHLEKNWPGTHWSERPGVVMVMRGRYDGRRTKGVVDLEWFIRKGTRWRRFQEHVEEVWWTASRFAKLCMEPASSVSKVGMRINSQGNINSRRAVEPFS